MVLNPTTFEEFAARLQEQLESLSPSFRRIAQRVLTDPEGCAFMTVSELAEAVGVNESTVVRFAAQRGLEGYPGLARLCRAHLRDQAQTVNRFERLMSLDGGAQGSPGGLEQLVALDRSNIVRTFARLDRADWESAVQVLSRSRTVYVMGLRKSFTVAYLLSYLLSLIRDQVCQVTLAPGTFPDLLRNLGPEDAFVGIAIHRYTRDTVSAQEFARRRGAATIALTDNPASPLAAHSDTTFYVETASASILRSLTAFVSLTQALAGSVAVALGARTRASLFLEEDLLQEFHQYWQASPGNHSVS